MGVRPWDYPPAEVEYLREEFTPEEIQVLVRTLHKDGWPEKLDDDAIYMLRDYLASLDGDQVPRDDPDFAKRYKAEGRRLERLEGELALSARKVGRLLVLAAVLFFIHLVAVTMLGPVAIPCIAMYVIVILPRAMLGLLMVGRSMTYWRHSFMWSIAAIGWCVILVLVSLALQHEDVSDDRWAEALLVFTIGIGIVLYVAIGDLWKLRERSQPVEDLRRWLRDNRPAG